MDFSDTLFEFESHSRVKVIETDRDRVGDRAIVVYVPCTIQGFFRVNHLVNRFRRVANTRERD